MTTIPPVADDEAMRIAGTLTKAQRAAIKDATPHSGQWRAFAMHPADKNLRAKGLTNGLFANLTPLGLRVRAALQNGGTGDGQ